MFPLREQENSSKNGNFSVSASMVGECSRRLVPLAGLEPAHPCGQQILSLYTPIFARFRPAPIKYDFTINVN